jgi:hypothetical protein
MMAAPLLKACAIGWCAWALLVWASLIVSKLFWLQIVRHKEFVEKAQKQQQHTFEVAPRRGVLYDRNLRELAMTVQATRSTRCLPKLTTRRRGACAGADRPYELRR